MSRPESPPRDDEHERLESEIALLDQQIENLQEIENVLENAIVRDAQAET